MSEVKTYFGSFVSKRKAKVDSDWVGCTFVRCDSDGEKIKPEIIVEAYADKTMLLTKHQVVKIRDAKKGDELELDSPWTVGDKTYKAGEKYKFEKDSCNVQELTFEDIESLRFEAEFQSKKRLALAVGASKHASAFELPVAPPKVEPTPSFAS